MLGVTETWLDGAVPEGEVKIDGHNIVRKDRNRLGRRCLYVHTRWITWAYGPRFHRGGSRFPLPLYAFGRPPPDVDGLSGEIKLLTI